MAKQTKPQPYRIIVEGSSLVMRTESLTGAVREAEKLAQRMKADVRVYDGRAVDADFQGRKLIQTVRSHAQT